MVYRKIEITEDQLIRALKTASGSTSRAAHLLDVSPATVRRWLKANPSIPHGAQIAQLEILAKLERMNGAVVATVFRRAVFEHHVPSCILWLDWLSGAKRYRGRPLPMKEDEFSALRQARFQMTVFR